MRVLVLNSGSSSIKFSIFSAAGDAAPELLVDGELSGVGSASVQMTVRPGEENRSVEARDSRQAISLVLDAVAAETVDAVGYRVVHPGAKLTEHQRITPEVLQDLEAAVDFAPLHDPVALELIHAGMERFPKLPHYACFDTVFHRTMPEEASVYALPKVYRDKGVRRYGFHGLSCESVVEQLRAKGALPQRMAIAHLGSGCSVTAVVEGESVDTTMGLTPTGGVVMGTRPGDLDPGAVIYLLRQMGVDASAMEQMLNHKAGMVALSGRANDVKALRVAAAAGDADATLALNVFTRSVRKAIGGFAWLLGGLDAVVFTGGIGEHDAATRKAVMDRDSASDPVTEVLVVPAQEDLMIARYVRRMMAAADSNSTPIGDDSKQSNNNGMNDQ